MNVTESETITGWCSDCHEPCVSKPCDTGIGPYEYWGKRCLDRHIELLSSCCHADILESDPEPHCDHCGKRAPQDELDEYAGWCAQCQNEPIGRKDGHEVENTVRA